MWNPISESQHFYFVEDTDYLSYSTVEEYVLDMAVKALTLRLEKDATCGGHKIKIKRYFNNLVVTRAKFSLLKYRENLALLFCVEKEVIKYIL